MNWTKIKNEYINGYISYRDLAEKHGLSFSAVSKKAREEQWRAERDKQREINAKKVIQKTAEKIAEQESDLAADLYSASVELLAKIRTAIQQTDLYIEKTQLRVPKKVKDKATGETYTAWQTEENIRLTKKEGSINVDSALKLTNALRSLQSIQTGMQEDIEPEAPKINIVVTAATPEDRESDE